MSHGVKNINNSQSEQGQSEQRLSIWLLRILIFCGVAAYVYYFSWWIEDSRYSSPWLVALFLAAFFYSSIQMLGNWYLYLVARRTVKPPQLPKDITVDVFVTCCSESYEIIERALVAACELRGYHNSWLLDDSSDPTLDALAKRLGAGHITRKDKGHAKAGNINHALPLTDGDIIAIFDIDHVPHPDYLEETVGHFADPRIGFVQVMLTFENGHDSWIAGAAMESSLEFYNSTYLGTEGVGGTTMMGSNSLIRRKALDAIGGYQPGLAEDLATSIALHAAGWQSRYVMEPLAPGIAPPDLAAWFTQQLKWARGVFELLLTTYPRLFPRLSWGQRLSYAVRMTRYWIGPAIGLHLFATIAILIFGDFSARAAFRDYLFHLAPLAIFTALIPIVALRVWQHPETPRVSLGRAVALVYSTWPVYLTAWLMALLRIPLGFRPTPKMKSGRLNPLWLLPQFLACVLITAGLLYTILIENHPPSLLLMFASGQAVLQLYFFARWYLSSKSAAPRQENTLNSRQVVKPDFL